MLKLLILTLLLIAAVTANSDAVTEMKEVSTINPLAPVETIKPMKEATLSTSSHIRIVTKKQQSTTEKVTEPDTVTSPPAVPIVKQQTTINKETTTLPKETEVPVVVEVETTPKTETITTSEELATTAASETTTVKVTEPILIVLPEPDGKPNDPAPVEAPPSNNEPSRPYRVDGKKLSGAMSLITPNMLFFITTLILFL